MLIFLLVDDEVLSPANSFAVNYLDMLDFSNWRLLLAQIFESSKSISIWSARTHAPRSMSAGSNKYGFNETSLKPLTRHEFPPQSSSRFVIFEIDRSNLITLKRKQNYESRGFDNYEQ